jgi:membrane protein DedA with SNARE-associated domain
MMIGINGYGSTIVLSPSKQNLAMSFLVANYTTPASIGIIVTNLNILRLQPPSYNAFLHSVVVDSSYFFVKNIDYFCLLSASFASSGLSSLPTNGSVVSLAKVKTFQAINCTFTNNQAFNGGALFLLAITSVLIEDCLFQGNIAGNTGGALAIDNAHQVVIKGCVFIDNTALNFGGSISLNDIKSSTLVTQSWFSFNSAKFGSALILKSCMSVVSLFHNHYSGNMATYEGTVYWFPSSGMPAVQDTATNHVEISNSCNRGRQTSCGFSTEFTTLSVTPDHLHIASYVPGDLPLHVSVALTDAYGRKTSVISGDGVVEAMIASPYDAQCSFNYLSAHVSGSASTQLVQGTASNMSHFTASCIPGGNLNLTFRTVAKSFSSHFPNYISTSIDATTAVTLSTRVPVSFRKCVKGEIFDRDSPTHCSCVRCSDSYSFLDNSDNSVTQCQSCPSAAAYCTGDQIALNSGTWRWQAEATTVFSCPYSGACLGGTATGDATCALGNYGPLCGLCSSGYFLSVFGSGCVSCQGSMSSSIAVTVVLVLLLAVVIVIAARKMQESLSPLKLHVAGLTQNAALTVSHTQSTKELLAKLRNDDKVYAKAFERGDNRFAVLKIVLNTFQTISNSPIKYNLGLTPILSQFMNVIRNVNFDVAGMLPMSCFLRFNYQDAMMTITLMPILITLLLYLAYVIQRHVQTHSQSQVYAYIDRVLNTYPIRVYRNIYITIYLIVTYYTLPTICTRIIGSVTCISVDPNKESISVIKSYGSVLRLQADFSVDCESSSYYRNYVWAMVMVIVYFLCVPGSYFYLLYQHRDLIRSRGDKRLAKQAHETIAAASRRQSLLVDTKNLLHAIGFIYLSYRPEMWYFEVVELSRRLFFSSLLAFIVPDPLSQLLVGVVFAAFFYWLYVRMRPYDNDAMNEMAHTGNIQLLVTFLLIYSSAVSAFGDTPSAYNAVDVTLFVVNLVILVQATVYAISEFRQSRRESEEGEGGSDNEDSDSNEDKDDDNDADDDDDDDIFNISDDSDGTKTSKHRPYSLIMNQVAFFQSSDVDELVKCLISLPGVIDVHIRGYQGKILQELSLRKVISSDILFAIATDLSLADFHTPEVVLRSLFNNNSFPNMSEVDTLVVIPVDAFEHCINLNYVTTFIKPSSLMTFFDSDNDSDFDIDAALAALEPDDRHEFTFTWAMAKDLFDLTELKASRLAIAFDSLSEASSLEATNVADNEAFTNNEMVALQSYSQSQSKSKSAAQSRRIDTDDMAQLLKDFYSEESDDEQQHFQHSRSTDVLGYAAMETAKHKVLRLPRSDTDEHDIEANMTVSKLNIKPLLANRSIHEQTQLGLPHNSDNDTSDEDNLDGTQTSKSVAIDIRDYGIDVGGTKPSFVT